MELENASLYFKSLSYNEFDITPLLRKHWESELANGGRDYRFAVTVAGVIPASISPELLSLVLITK